MSQFLDNYQRALIIYKEINEENSIDVSWVYHKIAELYEEQGNHAMAQEYLSKCAVDKVVVARVYTEFANKFIQHFDIFKFFCPY